MEAIRAHAQPMQGLTVLALQLVIAHCELASTLWQQSSVGVNAAQLDEVRVRHAMAVRALRAGLTALPGTFRPAVEVPRSVGTD